jgi:hypothetical protein
VFHRCSSTRRGGERRARTPARAPLRLLVQPDPKAQDQAPDSESHSIPILNSKSVFVESFYPYRRSRFQMAGTTVGWPVSASVAQ